MAKSAGTLTAGELAAACGVTPAAVTNWKSDGCPCRMQSGRPVYVLSDVIDWRIARAKESAAPLDREAEQVRKLKAEADRVELDVAKVRATLVPQSEFDRVVAEDHTRVRAVLSKIPAQFGDLVSERTGCTMSVAHALLADIVDATMKELQSMRDDE